MTLIQRAIVAVLFLANCHVSFSQELWRGTRDGMSAEEVTKILPEAHTAEASEGHARLTIDKVVIGKRNFIAWFYFKDEKLKQVILAEMVRGLRGDEADGLRDMLRLKYGPEMSARPAPLGTYLLWVSGKTTIELKVESVATSSTTTITYSTRLVSEAEKL